MVGAAARKPISAPKGIKGAANRLGLTRDPAGRSLILGASSFQQDRDASVENTVGKRLLSQGIPSGSATDGNETRDSQCVDVVCNDRAVVEHVAVVCYERRH